MITDLLLIDSINENLHKEYRVLDGRPIYRLVWSPDQREVRKGIRREFYGHIFLREYVSVEESPKYWYFQNPCWLLEKLVFIKNQASLKDIVSELPNCANGSYEPIYLFIDKDYTPLPITLPIVEFIIWKLHNPTALLTPSQLDDMRIKLDEKEVKYFEEKLGDGERSPLFVTGDSAFVSSNQQAFRQTRSLYDLIK